MKKLDHIFFFQQVEFYLVNGHVCLKWWYKKMLGFFHFTKVLTKKVSKHDQEKPQSQTADKPVAS